MSERKVFLVQGIIPNYRVPVFQRLGRLDGVDLTVFYSRPNKKMVRAGLRNADNIKGFKVCQVGLLEFGPKEFQFGILKYVISGRPDVVIAGKAPRLDMLLLLVLCKLFGIRMLWYLGGVPHIDREKVDRHANSGKLNRVLGRFNPQRKIMITADGVIAYSDNAKAYYAALGFPASKIWVAPNSPDTEALQQYEKDWRDDPGQIRALRRRVAPSGEKVIFLLGRLNRARKVDVLLRALGRVKDKGFGVSLVVVGDGGERENLQELSTSLGLANIVFEGAIFDDRELSKYFMASDIFVTPGVASLAIKMAMLFGLPVVTVDYGLEVHSVSNGVNGFIFPMDDDDRLAEIIMRLVESDALMKEIGENGQRTIQKDVNIFRMIDGLRRAIFDLNI